MDYFKLLNLNREPFSNSPDPDLFFRSGQHTDCLQRLELALRLRRGVNVVIGDVGTGKTTLCRQLIRKFANDEMVETSLILDPAFGTPLECLAVIGSLFKLKLADGLGDERDLKEQIMQYLFRKGTDEKKIVILLIDEGQKLPDFSIEILREFLNYETNQYKLLQIVIFAQKEFKQILHTRPNFADRVNLCYRLGPLRFGEMRKMIRFRLERSGFAGSSPTFFSLPALWEIYRSTGGYPRKVIHLCHQVVLMMILHNHPRVGWSLVRNCARRLGMAGRGIRRIVPLSVALLAGIGMAGFMNLSPEQLKEMVAWPARLSADVSGGSEEGIPASPEFRSREERPPSVLGQIAVNPHETLGELVRGVYGTVTPRLLRAVTKANVHIWNPHRVSVGQMIAFPAIPLAVASLIPEGYRVEIAKAEDLESAVNLLRLYGNEAMSVRLIPYWNRREGLKFSLVLDEYFSDKAAARHRLSELRREMPLGGNIADTWDSDTIFFAIYTSASSALPAPEIP